MNESIPLSVYRKAMNDILYWVFSNVDESRFKTRSIYGADGRTADYGTIRKVSLERGNCQGDDGLLAEATECLIFDNDDDLSFLPNYVTLDNGVKLYKSEYVDMANRVSAYEVLNGGKSPAIVYRTSQPVNKTFDYFVHRFGQVYSIDEALGKIQGNGYDYYYNSAFDNITAIDKMFDGSGINCTDAAQVFYRIGQALGYEVQFVHVMCRGGDGHIRLRLRHDVNTGGEWIYRDPADVLDGGCIECNWCIDGTVIAYDPAWIFTDLDQ